MLSNTGRSARAGKATRPRTADNAKSATVAIAMRSETDQSGGRLARITLFTGQVRPQARTTVISSRMP